MKSFFKIVRFIWRHPLSSRNKWLALKNLLSWQLAQILLKRPVLYPFVEDSVLLIEKGMTGATGNIYTGLTEFEDMMFVLHALRKDDIFGDVGANIGVYTVLASGNAGAKSIAVEPGPSTIKKLKRNVDLNEISDMVTILPYVAGAATGPVSVRFTQNMDTINHVIRDEEHIDQSNVVEVPVKTLDELFSGHVPPVVKIDVEGFEWPVLGGAHNLLGSTDMKALIIELNGSGASYGYSDEQIHQMLLSYHFNPYSYDAFSRTLALLPTHGQHNNTIYIKDLDWATNRVRTARKFRVFGQDV